MADIEMTCKWIELKLRPLNEEERKEYEELNYNTFSYDSDGAYIWDCELPEDGEEVLVTNGKWVDTDIFDHYDSWNCGFESFDADEITHWMRMPKLPKDIKVEWTGSYPCLCSGVWILKIDGKDYSDLIPFITNPANTYGTYEEWHFEDWLEVFEDYEDGLKEYEWIEENKTWLDKLPEDTDYHEVFKAFQEQDWRHGSCGGCI